MKLSSAACALLLLLLAGCKKDAPQERPDAAPVGPPDAGTLDLLLGMSVNLPPEWIMEPSDGDQDRILVARRHARTDESFFVSPKIIITRKRAAHGQTIEEVAERTLSGLKSLTKSGLKFHRTTRGQIAIAGVTYREIEVSYSIPSPVTTAPQKEVVQRTLVTIREGLDGLPYEVDASLTYLAQDEETVGPEVTRILSSLAFHPEVLKPPVP